MGYLSLMEVEVVRRAIVSLKYGKVLRAKMRIDLLAREDRKQERKIRIVTVEEIQSPQVQCVVAGHGGEVGIELVVGLDKEIPVSIRETPSELAGEPVELMPIRAVHN